MKKPLSIITGCLLLVAGSFAQTVSQKLQKAFQQFEADPQLKHAISSLYVINAKTGKVVFDKNSQVGLAPASTQKIITGATAFELLGKDYRYVTKYSVDATKDGDIIIYTSGDPTLGSNRFSNSENTLPKIIIESLKSYHLKKIQGDIIIDDSKFDINPIPDGWIWQDIGNYYGAGNFGFNWQENQYNIFFKSGLKEGDSTFLKNSNEIINQVFTGKDGSGDNAYLYRAPYSNLGYIKGTIPPNMENFSISVSMPSPAYMFGSYLIEKIKEAGIEFSGRIKSSKDFIINGKHIPLGYDQDGSLLSTKLDSIIYWFLQKSINLYGEALIKTFAYEKKGFGSTDSGVVIVKDFWKQKGIDEDELNISDGSGLSPQNRVTTHAQVEILKYAKGKDWFPYFYNALPEYNGMKMKSGTIKDVKAYCGYQKASDGNEYIFSFLVNNYNGPSSGVVNKMYKVLDILK